MNILRTSSGYQCENLHVSGLPPRQSQVFLLRAKGKSIRECAQLLNCSQANIKQLSAELFYKMRVDKSAALMIRAFETGHLQLLSIAAAFFITLFSSVLVDNHSYAGRLTRTPRTAQSSRTNRTNNFKFMELC